jgi:hypothetical protein
MQCLNGTDIDTRGFSAMIAPENGKISPAVGKGSLFNILHPGAIHTERHLVFGFACDRACMASDTFPGIDNKTVIH